MRVLTQNLWGYHYPLEGPGTGKAQTNATYTVTVTNSGTAPAAVPI